jgi:hypothetical protein
MKYTTITIGGHLVQRILCDEQGASIAMPPLYPSQYQFKLKLVTIADDGGTALAYPNVTALNASIGLIYAEPRAGTFKMGYNGSSGTLTEQITFNEDAGDFMTKLMALPESAANGLSQIYQPTPSTWMCKFDSPVLLPITLVGYEVELEPETFVRVRQFHQSGDYWLEIRLMQGPIASTSAHGTILSDPPVVREIRAGYTDQSDPLVTIVVNEVQAIYVPPGFQGTFIVKFQGRQTRPLSVNDGAANIATAMNAMYTDNVIRFTVSNPEVNNAYVEFVGPLGGTHFDPLALDVVVDASHTSLVFNLDLNTVEVADALRTSASVDAMFEINLHVTDPSIVPPAPPDPGQDILLFQAPVTILRPLHWEGLEAAAPINWLFPPNPKDYIPYTMDQAGFGAVNYSIPFGDGVAFDYSIAHDLNSSNLQVSVRQNVTNGRQLRDDEFTVTFDNNMALTIHVVGSVAPTTNSLIAVILSSGIENVFSPHHHTIPQIDGLEGMINEMLVRISALEAYIPTVGGGGGGPGPTPFGPPGSENLIDVTIPDIWNVVPTNRLPGKDKPADASALPSQGLLLPAVHDAIPLGNFTADASTNLITLASSHTLVDGQRVRIDAAVYSVIGNPTFINSEDPTTPNTVVLNAHGLVNGRRVQFSGDGFPTSVARFFTYYVINQTANTFQLASTPGGALVPILGDADTTLVQYVSTRPEPPTPLSDGVDYFVIAPTSTTFKLSASLVTNTTPPPSTKAGPVIDLTDSGYPTPVPMTMSTISDAPALVAGRLPLATDPANAAYIGHAFSIRDQVPLAGGRGIRASTANPGDIVGNDGRLWYPVTRSDSPGSNSFYSTKMENEIFRLAINDHMLKAGTVLTVTFDLTIRMYKHTSNIQYILVIEWADLPSTLVPAPTGPNIYAVDWSNRLPILKQKIIATELSFLHSFGAQVIRTNDGRMQSNKKAYGVQVAGDSIPPTANFAIRGRLIEFDTEDNVKDAQGLVYYAISGGKAVITTGTPETPTPQ